MAKLLPVERRFGNTENSASMPGKVATGRILIATNEIVLKNK